MIDSLFIVAMVMMFAIYIGTFVVGVVVSRRAWKRHGWEEMKLVYWGLILGPVITIAASLIQMSVSYLATDLSSFSIFGLIRTGANIAAGLATVMVAVGLYRLARRGALLKG